MKLIRILVILQHHSPGVDVVEVLGGPVKGQALDSFVVRGQNVDLASAVTVDLVDDVQNHIGVEDGSWKSEDICVLVPYTCEIDW